MTKKTKLLTIQIIYQDRNQLLDIFQKMTRHIRRGVQEKSDSWTINKSYSYYNFTHEFAPRYDFKESHINGNVCHVYKSKI